MLGTLHHIFQQYPDARIGVFGYQDIATQDPPLATFMADRGVRLLPPLVQPAAAPAKLWQTAQLIIHPKLGLTADQRRFLYASDLIVAKGQETLTESYGPVHFLDSILDAYLASRTGRPVILLGHSIGPIRHPLARPLAQHVLGRLSKVQVRDSQSRRELAGLGYPADRITQDRDLAYTAVANHPFPKRQRGNYALVIPNAAVPRTPDQAREYLANLGDIIAALQGRGYEVRLASSVTASDWNNDYRYCHLLQAQHPAARIVHYTTLNELLADLYQAAIVVSSRLHPVILSDAMNTPFIALSKAAKVLGLIADAGRSDRALHPFNPADPARLAELMA